MAERGYAAFRNAVLEGTDPAARDHPTKRARAAWDYYVKADRAARDAEGGAAAALEKAQAQVDGAERALAEAKKARATAKRELEWAREVVKDVTAEHGDGPDGPSPSTDAEAGSASAEGGA